MIIIKIKARKLLFCREIERAAIKKIFIKFIKFLIHTHPYFFLNSKETSIQYLVFSIVHVINLIFIFYHSIYVVLFSGGILREKYVVEIGNYAYTYIQYK